ncbi:hypothetical protein IHE45_17G053200 [Dioscorea alata]|uniref:Uncharacterized protein n=1 Tax=Dioscorea alata TaxID=55571 RepID=A0ACB7UCA3_DIOAL|nr:hypothetical protein IHE45_17G053200 [Dioscorea alata]
MRKAEVECGGAVSGQVYLNKYYISYNYYTDGVPRGWGGGGDGGGGGFGGQRTGKIVAIIVGGAAGLGFVVICLLFDRSLRKGKDGHQRRGLLATLSLSSSPKASRRWEKVDLKGKSKGEDHTQGRAS